MAEIIQIQSVIRYPALNLSYFLVSIFSGAFCFLLLLLLPFPFRFPHPFPRVSNVGSRNCKRVSVFGVPCTMYRTKYQLSGIRTPDRGGWRMEIGIGERRREWFVAWSISYFEFPVSGWRLQFTVHSSLQEVRGNRHPVVRGFYPTLNVRVKTSLWFILS